MKSFFAIAAFALIALTGETDAINLKLTVKDKAILADGPTNGEMSEDEKDTLIQVLCPGNIQILLISVLQVFRGCTIMLTDKY